MKQFGRKVSQWALTLHIYLSMAGFVLIFLFAITGLTLNHADFGLSTPRIETSTIELPAELMENLDQERLTAELRRALGVTAPVTLYQEFPDEMEVVFTAPGSRTHVVVNRADGTAAINSEKRGFLGKIGDLHKGRDSGRMWFWIIDITAVLLTISSISGLVTLACLPNRRRSGFIMGAVGIVITITIWILLPK